MKKLFFVEKDKDSGFSLIETMVSLLLLSTLVLSSVSVFTSAENGRILGDQNAEINDKMRKIHLLLTNPSSCTNSLKGISPGQNITLSGGATDTDGNIIRNKLIADVQNQFSDVVYYSEIESIRLGSESLKIRDDSFAKVITIIFNRIKGSLKGQKALRQLTVDVKLNGDGSVANCYFGNDTSITDICNSIGATSSVNGGTYICSFLKPIGDFDINGDFTVSEGTLEQGLWGMQDITINGNFNMTEPVTTLSAQGVLTVGGNITTEIVSAPKLLKTKRIISQDDFCLFEKNIVGSAICRKFHLVSCPSGHFAVGMNEDGSLECNPISSP